MNFDSFADRHHEFVKLIFDETLKYEDELNQYNSRVCEPPPSAHSESLHQLTSASSHGNSVYSEALFYW